MWRTRSFAVIAQLALAAPACSQYGDRLARIPARHSLRREVLGCYALANEHGGVLSPAAGTPPTIRLDSTARGGGWRLQPDSTTGAADFTGWWADSLSDTLRLTFSDGFSGSRLALKADGTRLEGYAVGFTDVGPKDSPKERVIGKRVDCVWFSRRVGSSAT